MISYDIYLDALQALEAKNKELEAQIVALEEERKGLILLTSNIPEKLTIAEEVVLAALPLIKHYTICGLMAQKPLKGTEGRFFHREDQGVIDDDIVYDEALEVIGIRQ